MRSLLLFSLGVLGVSACAPAPPSEVSAEADYDWIVSNGRIVDGTGAAWFVGDIGVRGDRIATITPAGGLAESGTVERIDASGMVVSPGFIDIQSHSRDAFLSGDGRVISKVTQGITTEILGEGWTNAPANDKTLGDGSDLASETEDPEIRALMESFRGPRGFQAWLEAMENNGISSNVGSFVGATTVRVYAKGEEMGVASEGELETMRRIVRAAMEDGAFGVASALIYPPGNFASTEELVEVAKAMAPFGGIYISHIRSEGDQFREAVEEAIRIGREGGVAVEIYHLKSSGSANWHKTQEIIDLINDARASGMDIQANMYPYIAGGTGLSALLPPWASADGKLLDNLRDPETRARIHDEVLAPESEWENLGLLGGPGNIMVASAKGDATEKWMGMRLSEIAIAMGVDWVDAAIEILLTSEDVRPGMVLFLMHEENLALQMREPWIKFGTDASGLDPDNVDSLAHPRSYGTYPRILGRYVREQQVLGLEDAIRKMSSAVATRLFIQDRGLLKEGFFADLVVFDPETVRDLATFEAPHQLSVGVRDVFVNGVPVVREGSHTGAKPGRVVRGAGYLR